MTPIPSISFDAAAIPPPPPPTDPMARLRAAAARLAGDVVGDAVHMSVHADDHGAQVALFETPGTGGDWHAAFEIADAATFLDSLEAATLADPELFRAAAGGSEFALPPDRSQWTIRAHRLVRQILTAEVGSLRDLGAHEAGLFDQALQIARSWMVPRADGPGGWEPADRMARTKVKAYLRDARARKRAIERRRRARPLKGK